MADPAGSPRSPEASSRLRSVVAYALLGVLLLLVVRRASQPLTNYDTYFHLRFGHEFLGGWSLRDPGHVTSFESADWVPTQWLSQIAMAGFEDWFGLPGVSWLTGAAMCLLVLVFHWSAGRFAVPVIASTLAALAVIACWPSLSARPHLVSFALAGVAATLWIDVDRRPRGPWLIVPLTWVWAMCHGMWPVSIAISLAALAGLAGAGRLRARPAYLAVPVLSGAVAALTPVGPELYSAVLEVNGRSEYFGEWAPFDFVTTPGMATLALLAVVVVIGLRLGVAQWPLIALTVLAGGLAVYSTRTVPVAVAILVPLAAIQLQRLLGERRVPTRREAVVRTGIVAGALVVLAPLAAATTKPLVQPVWFDDAIAGLPSTAAVLTTDKFGGYLMWRYPDLDFVAHGYGDVYTDAEIERNAGLMRLDPGWRDDLAELGLTHALVEADTPLAYALEDVLGWEVLHRSENVVMLLPTGQDDQEGAR